MNIEYGLCCVENEGALRMVEGTRVEKTMSVPCTDILYNKCQDVQKCFRDCRNKYGFLASGGCNSKQECECSHPC